ncbi:hypothetical protein [Rahnella sp. NRRL B-41462]|uniref:hypothetical protein n=1 Tax=Rahnella sp. NRRL B-41462 TaxID=1610579 RepID=UPI00130040FC|nr:hypothetical protein [Rahnella sp. NRRL B-41462]
MIEVGKYVTCTFDKDRRKFLVIAIDTSKTPPSICIRYPNGMEEWVPQNTIESVFDSSD